MSMEDKRHELFTEIADHVESVLKEYSIDNQIAEQAGCAVSDHLAEHWGGSTFSFPKDFRYRISQRDQEILSKFTGTNHHQLAVEYGMTENTIYKILKRVQERNYDRRQIKLEL